MLEKLKVGVGILHPDGTKSPLKEPSLVARSGPTLLESKECLGPTKMEEKKSEGLLPG